MKVIQQTLKLYFMLLLLFLAGCKEEFFPEIESLEVGVLVVEGYLDSEGSQSELKLSKTLSISDFNDRTPELGAIVQVHSEGGISYPLTEKGEGVYTFQYDLNETSTYSLEIQLGNGKVYYSDPIQPIITPPILDAGFVKDEEGVEVFVNTKGDENADDFLWTFEETWIVRPRIRTTYIYDAETGEVRTRKEDERTDLCYQTIASPDILLETSSRFENQVVFRQTITEIPFNDERIAERYSVLISQKALDPGAVEFWEILKKNSLDLGSVFSPLPSLISGNIHSQDENEKAVGYVSIGAVRQQRIFISNQEVKPWIFSDPEFDDCFISIEPLYIGSPEFLSSFRSGGVVPAREFIQGTSIVGYYTAPTRCADCTLFANREKPEFWED